MSRQTRRTFLKRSLAAAGAGAAFTVAGTQASAKVLGANDRVRVGVAGIHGRGGSHIGAFAGMKDDNVEVTALIDPDSNLFKSRQGQVQSKAGNTPKCYQDIRKALDEDAFDAVSVATCNHWHSLITFWACQHGKHVYVEKPCSHNVFEGRQCLKAARKYKCIVQHGTQSRASGGWAKAVAAAASGEYGKLLVSKAYASKGRWSIGFAEPQDPPAELDFDIWLGPAPKQPYHRNLVHYNWHWFWDTGNGEIGNQGVHQMDIGRWVMTACTGKVGPESVISMGGRFVNEPDHHYKDQGQTPNMQITVFDFGGPLLVFEVCGLVGKAMSGGKKFDGRVDNEFYMEAGVIRGGKFYPKGSDKAESLVNVDVKMAPGGIFDNFIYAIRSGDPKDLHADIAEAHPSAALCHLGNISYRLGEEVPFADKPEGFPQNDQVAASLKRLAENTAGALAMDKQTFMNTKYTLGAKLRYNADQEKFVGNAEADKLLTRNYREPYVVTEEV